MLQLWGQNPLGGDKMKNNEFIEFRDMSNNQITVRKSLITGIMIVSPVSSDPNAKNMIFVGMLTCIVSAEVANHVKQQLINEGVLN
jgi:hypothetical protein